MNPMSLYVIGGDHGLHKVGLSRDPEKRRRYLQTSSPVQLSVLFERAIDALKARDIERTAHDLLAEYRQSGEWFDASVFTIIEMAKKAIDSPKLKPATSAAPPMERKGKLGRPSLNVKSTNVRLSEDAMRRILALVSNRGMAKFIREAVAEKLEREEAKPKD